MRAGVIERCEATTTTNECQDELAEEQPAQEQLHEAEIEGLTAQGRRSGRLLRQLPQALAAEPRHHLPVDREYTIIYCLLLLKSSVDICMHN